MKHDMVHEPNNGVNAFRAMRQVMTHALLKLSSAVDGKPETAMHRHRQQRAGVRMQHRAWMLPWARARLVQ